jgi:threonine aldolase
MRFLAAPWVGMIESGAWLQNAAHANNCARYFAEKLGEIPTVQLASGVEANAVFLKASSDILDALRARGWKFYSFIGGAARFMFSWDSNTEPIDELCSDIL